MGANDPASRGVVAANSFPRAMVGRIYIVNHYALIHKVSWFHSEDFLKSFLPHYKFMEANDLQGVDNLDSGGIVGRIYVRDQQTLLHTVALMVINEKIF